MEFSTFKLSDHHVPQYLLSSLYPKIHIKYQALLSHPRLVKEIQNIIAWCATTLRPQARSSVNLAPVWDILEFVSDVLEDCIFFGKLVITKSYCKDEFMLEIGIRQIWL